MHIIVFMIGSVRSGGLHRNIFFIIGDEAKYMRLYSLNESTNIFHTIN